ncbi:MAG: magnesium transporter [Thermoplasmatota archaeon]
MERGIYRPPAGVSPGVIPQYLRSLLGSKEARESLFSLIFATFGNLLTGTILGVSTSQLELLPALIVLIPPAIGMRGSVFASLGSRLGTYLHTGQLKPDFTGSRLLRQNAGSSFILTILMSIYLGLLATIVAGFLGLQVTLLDMVLIALLAGVLSAGCMLLFTIFIAFYSYRRGLDPDNVTTPFITLAGDIVTLPLLFFALWAVLQMDEPTKLVLAAAFAVLAVAAIVIPFTRLSKPYCRRILLESIPILLAAGLLGTISGSVLGGSYEALIGVGGILIMIPAFLEDGGAIGGILAAKFSSALHLGSLEYTRFPPARARKLFAIMHIIGLPVFALLGVMAFFISGAIGTTSPSLIIMISAAVLAGEILILAVNFIAYYASMAAFRLGFDPDNVTIPIITALMDSLGTGTLIGVLFLLGTL